MNELNSVPPDRDSEGIPHHLLPDRELIRLLGQLAVLPEPSDFLEPEEVCERVLARIDFPSERK